MAPITLKADPHPHKKANRSKGENLIIGSQKCQFLGDNLWN